MLPSGSERPDQGDMHRSKSFWRRTVIRLVASICFTSTLKPAWLACACRISAVLTWTGELVTVMVTGTGPVWPASARAFLAACGSALVGTKDLSYAQDMEGGI